jgi:hypothetical protein
VWGAFVVGGFMHDERVPEFINLTFPAFVAVAVAVLSFFLAAWHGRREASKERQRKALTDVCRAAYNSVRQCHRDVRKFRDHRSEFEISCRVWAVEILHKNRLFVIELMEWMHALTDEAREISNMRCKGHDHPRILTLREQNEEFVGLISDWAAAKWWKRAGIQKRLRRRRIAIWGVVERRKWPRA